MAIANNDVFDFVVGLASTDTDVADIAVALHRLVGG
jgi:hypothetical protein